MIKIYKKELGRSYMTVKGSRRSSGADFQMKMLKANDIPGLLDFECRQVNGENVYLYDISGRQAFDRAFELTKVTFKDLMILIECLVSLSETLPEYILSTDNILLSPGSIFTDHEHSCYYFCLYPGTIPEEEPKISDLSETLSDLIDYEDKDAAALSCRLDSITKDENFIFSDLKILLEEGLHDETAEADPEPAVSVYDEERVSAEHPRPGLRQRFRKYFGSTSFPDIIDDVNNGSIIRKIRDCSPDDFPVFTAEDIILNNPEDIAAASGAGAFSEEISYEEDHLSDTVSLEAGSGGKRKLINADISDNTAVTITRFPFTIGKSEDAADCKVADPAVSRIHCRIYETAEGTYLLEDENSTNGTFLNGRRLEPYSREPLCPGDTIRMAKEEFYFL